MPVKDYEKIIWLEIHVRIKSNTKMFCNCKNALALADEPNVNVCPICMWFPGMLPTVNKEVVRLGLIWWMMMNCEVNKISRFDRKTYFYPDNPLSYQITQMYEPIVWEGSVKVLVNGEEKIFSIHHMHLENDAGKLVHAGGKTLCDYNRAGSPLMEIVTNPVFRDKEEVMEFLKELQKMMRAAGVSDADMEKWQLRCDVNLSIMPVGSKVFGTRVELKNINSFSSIGRAIDTEFARQVRILDEGWKVDQETRGWDDDKWVSTTQRSKEDAMDYRYFPEPDLLPIILEDDFIETARKSLPELPIEKRLRYLNEFKLWEDDARILSADHTLGMYFDKVVALTGDAKKSCAYITTVVLALMKDALIDDITTIKITPEELSEVIKMVNADELSSTNAKIVVEELFTNGWSARNIAESKNLIQKNDLWALESIVDGVISSNPTQVTDYKNGNEKIFWFLVGQCMKASQGAGNPKIFNEILKKKLG